MSDAKTLQCPRACVKRRLAFLLKLPGLFACFPWCDSDCVLVPLLGFFFQLCLRHVCVSVFSASFCFLLSVSVSSHSPSLPFFGLRIILCNSARSSSTSSCCSIFSKLHSETNVCFSARIQSKKFSKNKFQNAKNSKKITRKLGEILLQSGKITKKFTNFWMTNLIFTTSNYSLICLINFIFSKPKMPIKSRKNSENAENFYFSTFSTRRATCYRLGIKNNYRWFFSNLFWIFWNFKFRWINEKVRKNSN